MTVFKDIVSGRKYTDRNGQEKTQWTNVGTLIEKDGKQYVKLKAYPLPNEKGEVFLSVFEPREQSDGNRGGNQSGGGLEDSIPF